MLVCYSGRTLSAKAVSGPTTQASQQSDFVDRGRKAISKYMVVIKLRILTRSLKHLVNEALRRGLSDMGRRTKSRERVSTSVAALGRVRIPSIDNIAEALAVVEGEGFK